MATDSRTVKQAAFWGELRESRDYRDFLRIYLRGRSLSLSDFARVTGFGRGFPGDVLSGKRRLTAKSAPAFKNNLKLPLAGKKLFELLVAREESDVFPELDRQNMEERIARLRIAEWTGERRQLRELGAPDVKALLADPTVMAIFAATGDTATGASLEQIERRTRLFGRALVKTLGQLVGAGLLKLENARYVSGDAHVFLETHEKSGLLINAFQKASREAAQRVAVAAEGPEMFFLSNFCIREEDLPALKKELRELVLKFVDRSLEPSGDRIVKLLTALHL